MICRAEGLVLRSYRMSGSSKVAVVFTREEGKLRFAAKGARRPRSKFGASLEPITWGVYHYFRREGRELQSLIEADIRNPFSEVKAEYRRLVFASTICDLAHGGTSEEDRNVSLFHALIQCIAWMGTVPMSAVELPLWAFQLKAAALLGYRIHLNDCVKCGGSLPATVVRFSSRQGGVVCDRCRSGDIQLRRSTVGFLDDLAHRRPEEIDLDRFRGVDRAMVHTALRQFFDYYVGSRYGTRSFEFLDRMLAAESVDAPQRFIAK